MTFDISFNGMLNLTQSTDGQILQCSEHNTCKVRNWPYLNIIEGFICNSTWYLKLHVIIFVSFHILIIEKQFSDLLVVGTKSLFRVCTTPENLLEFVWSSWKFCIKCWWSTALVSNCDKTGYLIASLRNWSSFFYLCHGSVLCISCFCSIFRQTSRFGTLHSRPKQCKHVLDFSWNPSWNLLEISCKFV